MSTLPFPAKKRLAEEGSPSSLEAREKQLALSSRCQSEFLANMSHELRTPLNSLLILSKLLVDNPDGNLTPKQLAFVRTIHASGVDLLALINDVIELSKIGAGTLQLDPDEISLEDLCLQVSSSFSTSARERGLEFRLVFGEDLPKTIHTDGRRLQQVLRNLLLNAFKFTERGYVKLSVMSSSEDVGQSRSGASRTLVFTISDTGVGIPEEEQALVFEPFQQAGQKPLGPHRGAGLGLSLARGLAQLLGGSLSLQSSAGTGSTFTLRLPPHLLRGHAPGVGLSSPGAEGRGRQESSSAARNATRTARNSVIFAPSGDGEVARVLRSVVEREGLAFETRAVSQGPLLSTVLPLVMVLDLRPAGLEGWIALDQLSRDISRRHVPVFALAAPQDRLLASQLGALLLDEVSELEIDRVLNQARFRSPDQPRKLLVWSHGPLRDARMIELVTGTDVKVHEVASGEALSHALSRERFHALLTDVGPSETSLLEILQRVPDAARQLPVVVYSDRSLGASERQLYETQSARCSLRLAGSDEQLDIQVSMALHRSESSLTSAHRERLVRALSHNPELQGLTVLIVDDDVRNIFAMTSALERHGVHVLYAESGQQGLDLLGAAPAVDAVVVDIRMRDRDGYDVMRSIRREPGRAHLPLIAVTANAMQADRVKCMEMGATHYLAKPIDADVLSSTLRVVTARPAR